MVNEEVNIYQAYMVQLNTCWKKFSLDLVTVASNRVIEGNVEGDGLIFVDFSTIPSKYP